MNEIKHKIIEWIANGEPVLLNWTIIMDNVKPGKDAVFIPGENHNMTTEELTDSAVLVPMNAFRRDTGDTGKDE